MSAGKRNREALRAGCCRRDRDGAVLCQHVGRRWVHTPINYHDPAWYQHHYNVAYGLYDRGFLNDHDLPRLRPQHCRCHNHHHHGGADIHQHDKYDLDDINDSGAYDGSDEYVHVRRADYDNLVAAYNHHLLDVDINDPLYNAVANLIDHVNNDNDAP